MAVNPFNIAAVGDVMVDRERPETSFSLVRDVIQRAEISFCQLETAYSDKGSKGSSGPRGAMRHDLRNYDAIPFGGFEVVSMASNHALDWGSDALIDCIARLRRDGMVAPGAGSDIEEARQPAIMERDGTRIAVYPTARWLPGVTMRPRANRVSRRCAPSPTTSRLRTINRGRLAKFTPIP
jgi:poly-gamma-glutamate synthesis protein (capsule biosynthesis protein)